MPPRWAPPKSPPSNRSPDASSVWNAVSMPRWKPKSCRPPKARPYRRSPKRCWTSIDPDAIESKAKEGKPLDHQPAESELRALRDSAVKSALAPLATNPDLRNLLKKVAKAADQTIDVISRDTLIYAGPAQKSTQTSAQLATSFREYIEQHKAEITALQILYSRPYKQRLTEPMLKELEKKLRDNHAAWTEDRLWDAFAAHRARQGQRPLAGRTLCRPRRARPLRAGTTARARTLRRLRPRTLQRMASPEGCSRRRIPSGEGWRAAPGCVCLHARATRLAPPHSRPHRHSLSIEPEDLELSPFNQRGGLGKAHQLFGEQLPKLLDELNEVLAA